MVTISTTPQRLRLYGILGSLMIAILYPVHGILLLSYACLIIAACIAAIWLFAKASQDIAIALKALARWYRR